MNLFCDELSEALFRFMSDNKTIYDDWCAVLGQGYDCSMAEWVNAHYKDDFEQYCTVNGWIC